VLLTVNSLNAEGTRRIAPGNNTAPFYDVNADGALSPLDTLMIINYLNARSSGNGRMGEGEQASSVPFPFQIFTTPWLATRSFERTDHALNRYRETFELERTKSSLVDAPHRLPERTVWVSAATEQVKDLRAADTVFAKMTDLELSDVLESASLDVCPRNACANRG
jgi:hypothetical protein